MPTELLVQILRFHYAIDISLFRLPSVPTLMIEIVVLDGKLHTSTQIARFLCTAALVLFQEQRLSLESKTHKSLKAGRNISGNMHRHFQRFG